MFILTETMAHPERAVTIQCISTPSELERLDNILFTGVPLLHVSPQAETLDDAVSLAQAFFKRFDVAGNPQQMLQEHWTRADCIMFHPSESTLIVSVVSKGQT